MPAGPARLAGSLPPELRARTAQAEIDDRGASLTLVGGPHVRLGDPRDLSAKAKVAAAVLGAVGGAAIQYVDVSVPEAPVTG